MENKSVIVTGAAKGIGKAIALKFAEERYNIALNYKTSVPSALVSEIEEKGVRCLPFQADVSDYGEAEALVLASKEAFGSIDVLVNNAGITRDVLLMRMTEDDFDTVINTNLKGTFNMLKHVTKIMLKQRSGAIINMSSIVGITGNIGQANYAASKAGVIGLTYSVAKEVSSRGITCNAIAPGFIKTDMTNALSQEVKDMFIKNIPLGRFGEPSEIAELALFLARNKYITGQVITIDGGMTI